MQDSNAENVKTAYRSGEIAHYIPGTKIPFTLQGLGVKYNNINLYLMPFTNESSSDDNDKKYVTLSPSYFLSLNYKTWYRQSTP